MGIGFAYTVPNIGRFHAKYIYATERVLGGVGVIPEKIKTPAELNLPPSPWWIGLECDRGLVLVTGPTGSRKINDFGSLIHHINTTRAHHHDWRSMNLFIKIIKAWLIKEVGTHTKILANTLKSALREDPDILLVGELRDLETISLALTARDRTPCFWNLAHQQCCKQLIVLLMSFLGSAGSNHDWCFAESSRCHCPATLHKGQMGEDESPYEILRATKQFQNLIREKGSSNANSHANGFKIRHGFIWKNLLDEMVKMRISKRCSPSFRSWPW